MESEYHKIMDCLKNHSFSCVALKPTALIPVEKILYLSNLMEKENYHEIDLENLLKNSELENIAEPFSKLSKKAVEIGTKILIDAEQSNLQPGVDLLALFLMKQFNINQRSHIYNTYQLYLKDSPLRIEKHKQLIESENAQFAAKLVRGAYLSYEQNIKENAHRNYKICASKTEVDHNYNITVRELISNGRSSLIVATHNLESVKLLKSIMSEKIQFHSNDIEYAFLMGFGDKVKDLTMGLRCLEYVPYGPSEVKIPYLLRRLEENVHIFKSEK